MPDEVLDPRIDHERDTATGLPVVAGFIQYPPGHPPGPGNPIEPRRAMTLTCIADWVPDIRRGTTIRVESVHAGIIKYTVPETDPTRAHVKTLALSAVNDATFRRVMT